MAERKEMDNRCKGLGFSPRLLYKSYLMAKDISDEKEKKQFERAVLKASKKPHTELELFDAMETAFKKLVSK